MDYDFLLKVTALIFSILLSVIFLSRSFWLFLFRHKLGEIKVNIDQLGQYFGKKSFVYQRYIAGIQKIKKDNDEKAKLVKELENGLLKTRRHFYLPWFYFFLFGIFLFSILFFQTCEDHNKKTYKVTIVKDSLLLNDSIKISTEIHIEKDNCSLRKDIYSTDITVSEESYRRKTGTNPLLSGTTNKDMSSLQKTENKDTLSLSGTEDTLRKAQYVFSFFQDTMKMKSKNFIFIKIKGEDKVHAFCYKTHKKKDIYQSLTTILSMLTNVFLLSFFGFLNTQTDVFDKEADADNYSLLRMTSIFIFVLVCVIEGLYTYLPTSPSLYFVMEIIVAIISVIAVFGIWGSMNNQYTNFHPFFKCVVFMYAGAQIFAVFLEVDKIIPVILLYMVVIGKFCIIWKIWKLDTDKRMSWFFLNQANEKRTNNYSAFVKLLNEEENKENSR
jgi:hypothetical protein